MPTQQVGESGHDEEHASQHQVVTLSTPDQHARIHGFVDPEATCGHQEEPARRSPQGCRPVTKGQSMVAGKGHDEGHQPSQHIGSERVPASQVDQTDDDAPMHERRGTADGDEPADLAQLRRAPNPPGTGSTDLGFHDASEHTGQRAICIAVDDFGLHAGINRAALHLAGMGRVQAIGCMVGGTAWTSGIDDLRLLEPARVDLGLHLDLTERPLLPGTRRSLSALIGASVLRRLDRRSVRAEIRAQLDAFEAAMGRAPDYIDGHQHVHQLPIVRDELLAELDERYLGFKPWLRSTRRVRMIRSLSPRTWRAWIKPWVIQHLGAAQLASAATASGHRLNSRLLGVYDFAGGIERYAALIGDWLSCARHGDVLMCHPSVAIACDDPLIDARRAEFEVLCGPGFEAQLRHAAVALEPLSQIVSTADWAPRDAVRLPGGQGGS